MAEAPRTRAAKSAAKVQELIRDSLEVAQARLETLEGDAQKLIREVSTRVQKVSRRDWKDVRAQVDKLRRVGLDAAEDWKDRAQSFRGEAVQRLLELQVRAMKFLGVATREEVEELSREINKIVRRLDEVQKRRVRRTARKAAGVEA